MGDLWIVCGPAGVGKSTHGRRLAAKKQACLLDSDTMTEPVVRAGMELSGLDPDDRDSPDYRAAFREPVYECLFAAAAENLPHIDVIVVGPFTSEIRNSGWLEELEERFETGVHVVFLTCDESERRRRVESRGNPRDDLKLRDWARYLAQSDIRPPAFEHERLVSELLKA